MDERSLEERRAAAIKRQGELIGSLGMAGKPPIIPDIMTAIARLRVIRELVIRAGLVVDLGTGIAPEGLEEARELFDTLEAEEKAQLFQDSLDAAMGRPNAGARRIMATAEQKKPS